MKVARAAIVEQAVCDVGVLLELQQRNSPADRVDGPGGDVEKIAGLHRPPVNERLDRSVERGLPELLAADFARQAQADGRAGFGIEDVPALALAATKSTLPGVLVV